MSFLNPEQKKKVRYVDTYRIVSLRALHILKLIASVHGEFFLKKFLVVTDVTDNL
jgi:hypothetical protein